MTNSLRCILTICLVFMPVFILLSLRFFPKITRNQFALAMSTTIGLQLFLLSLMFVDAFTIPVALILLVLSFPGVYPFAYLTFPRYKERIEKRRK